MKTKRELTGKHAALIFGGFFGTIVTVNFVMAYMAVSTFPGLVVKNGYIASQQFNGRREAQMALGWSVDAVARDGLVVLSITDTDGNPVEVTSLLATVGRPTQIKEDTSPEFKFDGTAYVAPVDLRPGNWDVRMVALASNGTEFTRRVILRFQE
jgi:nitrogen fixation protein FixH